MQPLHARYPFLAAAREAVEAADVDLAAVVREGGAPVERGVERVERALVDGTVAPERSWSTRAELLSYPVARVLVSLVDVRGAVEKYARAEAALAYERFTDDFDDDTRLKSANREGLSLDAMLADFDLAVGVTPTGDGRFEVAVGTYLDLAAPLDGKRWRLAVRPLADGFVAVSRRELYELLREAVRERVADGLPSPCPTPSPRRSRARRRPSARRSPPSSAPGTWAASTPRRSRPACGRSPSGCARARPATPRATRF
ncbi:hypothetical protein [Halosegnis marinus]|uniref:hypothetical protein n=1 Tax=Halosegnis marinus TaxID=3034023 RepID=UPI00360DC302